MPEDKEQTITLELSPATSYLVKRMFDQSKERAEKETAYMKEAEAYVEALLDFAIKRKQSEWKSRDAYSVGKVLREALDKMLAGKTLTSEEQKLVKQFQQAQQASQPATN